MAASHHAYRHARLERLLDHSNLLRRGPAPTALNRCDDLNSIRRIGHRHGCMPHTCQVGDRVRSVRGLSHTPPADCARSGAGAIRVEINSIATNATRCVAVAVFVCGYAFVADYTGRTAVSVAISAHVLSADPACRIAVPISVRVHGAIAVNACRVTRSIRVKDGAFGRTAEEW